MENTCILLNKTYSLNQFEAKYVFEFDYLCDQEICFVPAKYEIRGKNIIFNYDLNYLTALHKNLKTKDILKLILNLIYFEKWYRNVDVEFNIENIYFDFNYIPKFLKRDIIYYQKTYITEIKNLLFYLVDNHYDYEYYKINGIFTNYKYKFLNEIKLIENLTELFNKIMEEYLK